MTVAEPELEVAVSGYVVTIMVQTELTVIVAVGLQMDKVVLKITVEVEPPRHHIKICDVGFNKHRATIGCPS